jgi:hypothetical protein
MRAALLLAPLIAMAAPSCGGAGELGELDRRAQEAAGDARDLARLSRAEVERTLEERLDRLREGLDDVRGDAAQAGEAAWRDVDVALRREIGEAEALLRELRASGDDGFGELRDDAAAAIRRVSDRLANAVDGH